MSKNKLYIAISDTLEMAAIILFVAWLFADVSGWYWFGCAVSSTFFDKIS